MLRPPPFLCAVCALQAQPGRWVLPPGQCHVSTPGELAVELVREKLLRRLHKELPYTLGVALVADRPWVPGGSLHGGRGQHGWVDSTRLGGDVNRHGAACDAQKHMEQHEGQHHDVQAADGDSSLQHVVQPSIGRFVHVEVLAANPRVKNIVIGPGGSIIEQYVTKPTQQELCDIFKQDVRLSVSVKVAA